VVAAEIRARRVLVTGGSRGLGRAIVEAFASAGSDVAYTYKEDEQAAEEVTRCCAQHGVRSVVIQADLATDDAHHRVVGEALDFLGGLDTVVNSAGIYPKAPIRNTGPAMLREILRLNVEAPFAVIRRAIEPLADSHGSVVNISSISAFEPRAGMAAYDASKAALSTLTKSAAVELGPLGIRVNAIAPGLVWSPGLEEVAPQLVTANLEHAPLGKLVQPDDVAQAVLFLAGEGAAAITGHVLVIDAGVSLVGYAHALPAGT
jgi:3-oxoacyl-[acyl-carrier protein] reductase